MKIIIRVCILFSIFTLQLFSNVTLNCPNSFVKGEAFIFEFEASGNSIKFPKIEKIDDYLVQNLGTSRSVQIINGNYSEKIIQKFQIFPQKEFTFPSFVFEIDKKEIKTSKKKIKQKLLTKTSSDDFDFQINASKTTAYVGEDILIKLIFKYRKDSQISDLAFETPHFENFWYKQMNDQNTKYEQGDYVVHELNYILFAQKQGNLKIDPLTIIVSKVKENSRFTPLSFLPTITEERIYSNSLEFDIKPLPKKVSLIGDFNIKATVDKNKIDESQSITLKLNIEGEGNFEDIKDYKLELDNSLVYENKAKIQTNYKNGKLLGSYEKIFSIVPSESLTIPSFEIVYFDKKNKKLVNKKTDELRIEVKNKKEKKEPVLQKVEEIKKDDRIEIIKNEIPFMEKLYYFLLGCFFTILVFALLFYVKLFVTRDKKDKSLLNKVKSIKNKEEMIKLLIPYLKYNKQLDSLIFECEETKNFKETKKAIILLLKQLDIKGKK